MFLRIPAGVVLPTISDDRLKAFVAKEAQQISESIRERAQSGPV